MGQYDPDPLTPAPFDSADGRNAREEQRKEDQKNNIIRARLIEELRKAQPSWRVDGHGIRGEVVSSTAPELPDSSTGGTPKGEGALPYHRAEPDAGPFPPFNTEKAAPVDAPTSSVDNFYDFEAFPANSPTGDQLIQDSNLDGPPDFGTPQNPRFWVLILDGLVFGPNNDPITGDDFTIPQGMGADDFLIEVHNDGDEIWLAIVQNDVTEDITSVTINTGSATPEDTDDGTTSVTYVTICTVSIDDSDNLGTQNNVCGDYVLTGKSSLSVEGGDTDESFEEVNDFVFTGAFTLSQNGSDEHSVNVDTALSAEDEDGDTVEHVNDLAFTTEGDNWIDLVVSGADGTANISITSNGLDDLQNQVDDLQTQLQNLIDSIQDC